MTVKKILLTGATGMLGKHIFTLLEGNAEIDLYAVGRSAQPQIKNYINADISNIAQLHAVLDDLKPECVIHCAAETNVNLCETDKERVYSLHVLSSEAIASKTYISKSIYVSTDSVFDGQRGNYTETDLKNPLNYYAKTKSLGEDMFLHGQHPAVIIRTNIIGYSTPFKSSLFEWAYQNLKQSNPVSGFTNIIFNPLYVKTLAEIVVNETVSKDANTGIYNFGTNGHISKYDFLNMMASAFDFQPGLISPVVADTGNGTTLRPLNTTLNIGETEKKLNIKFPTLQQEVHKIQEDLKQPVC